MKTPRRAAAVFGLLLVLSASHPARAAGITGPASQKSEELATAGGLAVYGPATGKARYVPEGYKAPAQRVQFVIFGDRNGGEKPGFMEQGIALVNLLRPEFVLSIGDQIPGYVKPRKGRSAEQAAAMICKQWVEQNGLVAKFNVPYFWAIGNHDMFDQRSGRIYTNMHGPRYYSFDAKNVHVIVLNSEEYQEVGGNGMLGEAQIAWLRDDLARNREVALTVIAVHNPVWADPSRNDWPAVEALLRGRNAIVFAGHLHQYSYELRGGIPHVIVGPVAGEMKDTKTPGRFRHVTLVTVEDGKPYVALIKLDAAMPMDVVQKASPALEVEASRQ